MPSATHVLLYDDHCPLCQFQMKVLTWMDWFNVLSLLPVSNPKAAQMAPGVARADLLEAIHCVTASGRIHRGARALRFVGMRMLPTLPMALFLWIPGVIWIAERVYMWVSRNRHLLSRWFGCKDACAVMPTRQRANEQILEEAEPRA